MIPVTKPFLPPFEDYQKLLKGVWARNWLTNNGPLVNELEQNLNTYLDREGTTFVANGTIALQLAIRTLSLKGEIITTPFSYVATSSSIVWEHCTPIFVDIDQATFNINPELIESAISKNTCAILGTHCFGNPCKIESIADIAQKYDLRVIYDASHCFGVQYRKKSIFDYGDVSTTSFHATKLFHTVEGGAVFCSNPDYVESVTRMRNFGHAGPTEFAGLGINGKNSEFHAAMGLLNLTFIDDILERRKMLYLRYLAWKNVLPFEVQSCLNKDVEYNFSYFPMLFQSESELSRVFNALMENEIFPRRYFYPTLDHLPYVSSTPCPVATDISCRILCMPMYHELSFTEVDFIMGIVQKSLRS